MKERVKRLFGTNVVQFIEFVQHKVSNYSRICVKSSYVCDPVSLCQSEKTHSKIHSLLATVINQKSSSRLID